MKFAVLSSDHMMVDNVIVAREDQQQELQTALGRVLMDEQVALPIGDNPAVADAIQILLGGDTDADE